MTRGRKPSPEEGGEYQTRLTPEGRGHATEVGRGKNSQPENAVAVGSPRVRSTETAIRHMAAGRDEITDDMSLEEMREVIGREVNAKGRGKRKKKEIVDERLNFITDGTPEYHEEFMGEYKKGEGLVYTVEKSDEAMERFEDELSTSYSRAAGNFAEIVKKYMDILPRWSEIVEKNPEKYKKFHYEMQRFLGSHGTVAEGLLLKVIEKKEGGKPAVLDFIKENGLENGFHFSEGYGVNLELHGSKPIVRFRYKDKEWEVSPDLIADIIGDRYSLNEKVRKLKREAS